MLSCGGLLSSRKRAQRRPALPPYALTGKKLFFFGCSGIVNYSNIAKHGTISMIDLGQLAPGIISINIV